MVQQASASAPLHPSPAERILIVDDEAAMCDICARTLRSAGYEVVATTDAQTALAHLRPEEPFDLLLVDIQMPGIGGLQLAQRARELDPAVVIIIMTGHTSIENLQQSARSGIADFLSKPFELETLRLAVEQALHKRRLLQERIRLHALEQLLESSKAINEILDREQLGQVILERALGHVSCQVGFLLVDDGLGGLTATQASPKGWELQPAGKQVALETYHDGVARLVEGQGTLCSHGNEMIQRSLVVPLRGANTLVGVLLLCDDRSSVLRSDDEDIIGLLANQAGTALHNAQLYSKLQQAYQSLQELDRLKSEFIAIASHELRTPLSIVLGYTAMVRDQSEGERREYAQRVLISAQRIKELVDDMVSLRNLDLHATTVASEACALDQLLHQAAERLQPVAQEKQQQLKVDGSPLQFLADREKQLLILGNLLANAIRFTPERGTIVLHGTLWRREELVEATRGAVQNDTFRNIQQILVPQWVVMRVRDTGIGVDRREQAQIFNRFYQVADSLTRDHGGAGLGLAIVHDLVALQGGVVWVESEVGNGSTFSCALPFRAAEEQMLR
jgi:signal transduction histidine kinase